jgi:hypothetical protein
MARVSVWRHMCNRRPVCLFERIGLSNDCQVPRVDAFAQLVMKTLHVEGFTLQHLFVVVSCQHGSVANSVIPFMFDSVGGVVFPSVATAVQAFHKVHLSHQLDRKRPLVWVWVWVAPISMGGKILNPNPKIHASYRCACTRSCRVLHGRMSFQNALRCFC